MLDACASAHGTTEVPGDTFANDPDGIVAASCPGRPKPANEAEWKMSNLHMLTRDFGSFADMPPTTEHLPESPLRVFFMGDSLTDNWINFDPQFFADGLIDRGIVARLRRRCWCGFARM